MNDAYITCAVTGGGDTVGKHPAIPVTPAEIAQAAISAAKAGAAVVHCHVRDPETGKNVVRADLFREVVDRIRDSNVDVVINLTGGGGGSLMVGNHGMEDTPAEGTELLGPAERLAFLDEVKPEICSLDCGSMTFGDGNGVYVAPPSYLRQMAARMQELGVKPELEIFDSGHLWIAKTLVEEGLVDGPPLFQFCMGLKFGAPQDLGLLTAMINLLPESAIWSAFGVSRYQIPMAAQAALLGGNCRVGLEDNLYLEKGVYASNAQLVERARTIIELMGGRLLTAKEVREKLMLRTP